MLGVGRAGKTRRQRLGGGRRRLEGAETVERAPGRQRRFRWPPSPPAWLAAPASATMRRIMSTNRPESGRFDHVVSAVT